MDSLLRRAFLGAVIAYATHAKRQNSWGVSKLGAEGSYLKHNGPNWKQQSPMFQRRGKWKSIGSCFRLDTSSIWWLPVAAAPSPLSSCTFHLFQIKQTLPPWLEIGRQNKPIVIHLGRRGAALTAWRRSIKPLGNVSSASTWHRRRYFGFLATKFPFQIRSLSWDH